MNNNKALKKEGVKFLSLFEVVMAKVYESIQLLEVREFLRNLRYDSMYAPIKITVQRNGNKVKIKEKSGKLGVLATLTLEETGVPQLIKIAMMGTGSLLTEKEALKCLKNSECTFSAAEAVEICTRSNANLNAVVKKCLSNGPLEVVSENILDSAMSFVADKFGNIVLLRSLKSMKCKIDDIAYEIDELRPAHYQNKFDDSKKIKVDKIVKAMQWSWEVSSFEKKKMLSILGSHEAPTNLGYSYRKFLLSRETGFEAARRILSKSGLAGTDEFPLLRARAQICYDLCNKNEHLND